MANLLWLAKLVSKVDGELTEVELFDDQNTKKTVEHIKLKPFTKLRKMPARRSQYWKDAYARALLEFD